MLNNEEQMLARIAALEHQLTEAKVTLTASVKWMQQLGPMLVHIGEVVGKIEARVAALEQSSAPGTMKKPETGL